MTKEMMTSQDADYIREDDELMRVMSAKQAEQDAAERDRLNTEIRCEAAKYNAYMRKVGKAYQTTARVMAALAGASAVFTFMSLRLSNALGVFIAAICTFCCIGLTSVLDKRARSVSKREAM